MGWNGSAPVGEGCAYLAVAPASRGEDYFFTAKDAKNAKSETHSDPDFALFASFAVNLQFRRRSSGQQPVAEYDQPFAQRLAAGREDSLVAFVVGSAGGV